MMEENKRERRHLGDLLLKKDGLFVEWAVKWGRQGRRRHRGRTASEEATVNSTCVCLRSCWVSWHGDVSLWRPDESCWMSRSASPAALPRLVKALCANTHKQGCSHTLPLCCKHIRGSEGPLLLWQTWVLTNFHSKKWFISQPFSDVA